jgi:ankyrin repeat protein
LGNRAATKLLIHRKAVVTTEDNRGHTARDVAEKAGSDHAIKAFNDKETGFIIYDSRMIQL